MTVRLLPYTELLVVKFLLEQPEVTDLTETVCQVLPKDKVWPAVRVTRFGGLPVVNRPLNFDAATLQIEGFDKDHKNTAWTVTETCRAVMAERLPGMHDDGQVTGVTFGAFAYVPDPTFDPAMHRFLFTATVYVKPLVAGS